MAGPSKELRSFIDSLEAPLTTREAVEGLDVASLARLKGEERDEALSRLVAHLARVADERAVRALGVVRTKAASRALQDVIARWRGSSEMEDAAAFEALWALVERGELANPVDALLDFLRHGKARSRARAAEALGGYSEDRVVDALTEALGDADANVRSEASRAVLTASGLARHADVIGAPLWLLKYWLALPYASTREPAMAELERTLEKQRAGTLAPPPTESPEHSEPMRRFLESKLSDRGRPPWGQDFDLESLGRLSGTERDWVEYSLITQLRDGDPRVPRALAALSSTRAVDPLREVVATSTGEYRDAAAKALEALEG